MKKTGLFKIIMFILLGIVVCTWIFSASYFNEGELVDLGMYNIGFFDYFQLLFGSFEFTYFLQIFILLVSIGALYGVLGKTGKYRAWIERIVNNFKGKETALLIIIAFVIAALTSVFDYGFCLFIFFPFVISIILAMGYDKITACLATFGAMFVGTIGSTLGYNTSIVVSELLEEGKYNAILFKIILFVLAFAILFYVLLKAKKSKSINTNEITFIGEKSSNKYSVAYIIVAFALLFILTIIGCTTWSKTFGIEIFNTFNTNIADVAIKLPYFHITTSGIDCGIEKIAIFGKLLGTSISFGEWYNAEMSIMCLIAALLLGKIYRVKNTFSAMADGAKKMLKPALLVLLAYCVVYFAGNTMFYSTLAELFLGITKKFNIFFSTISLIIASALNVDMLYVANYAIPQISAIGVDNQVLSVLAQGIYGVTMLIAPTSALLVLGLSYLEIPYKEWVKKNWILAFALLGLVLVFTIVMMFI